MRILILSLFLLALASVDGRGGIRIRIGSFGRSGGRSGGRSYSGRSSSSSSSTRIVRGQGGWFSSSGRQSARSGRSSYPRVYSHASYSRLRKDIQRESKKTNFGTKFSSQKVSVSKKLFGLGVGAGFIGGSGYGYGATLASYTVYHRYVFLMTMLHSNGYRSTWDQDYHNHYYEK